MESVPRKTLRPGRLQFLNQPRPVKVQPAGGVPSAIVRRGGRDRVAEIVDRWRLDDQWWTARPVARSYLTARLTDGRLVTLFRDETTGAWFEQKEHPSEVPLPWPAR